MNWFRPNSSAGPITSGFGPRGPIPGAPDASRYHLGVDLRAGTLGVSSDIYATATGFVRRIYQTPLGAWVLELDHGGGVRSRYAHMQRAGISVGVGAPVVGGQRIAAASKSGAPTIHLHFEILVNGSQVDPVPFLRARGVNLSVTSVSNPVGTGGSVAKPSIPGAPAPLIPEGDDMLLIRDNGSGAVMLVIGGVGAQVLGSDYAAFQKAGVPVAGVSAEQYRIASTRFLNR